MTRDRKWFGDQLRDLRQEAGYSLGGVQARTGFTAVSVGSYERCDRRPTVERADELLDFYGWQLCVVPKGYDLPKLIRERDELLEFQRQILAAAEAAGLVVRPGLAAVPDERAA